MPIRLDDIDYFLAVADEGQVHRAAARLGVSQPAVTKGLQRLEKELGFPLFDRGARGMTLTAVAEGFLQRTRHLRAGLDGAIKEAADLHLGAMGVLRVGLSPLYAEQLFVPASVQLLRQRPAARFQVSMNLNDALLAALRAGDIDLTLHALPGVMPADLQGHPLLHDDLLMVVRDGHPLLTRRRLRLRDLAQAQWLLPGPAVASRRNVEGRLAEAGLPPANVAIEVNNTAGPLARLLLQTDLVSLMSESILRRSGGRGLVALPMADARFPRTVGVVVRRDGRLPPLAQRFLEILQADAERRHPPR